MNSKGDLWLQIHSSSPEAEEETLRGFSRLSGGQLAVAGYGLCTEDVQSALESGTISACLEAGARIHAGETHSFLSNMGALPLCEGIVRERTPIPNSGFFECLVSIECPQGLAALYIKNEALCLSLNGDVIARCPTLILLLDDGGRPLQSVELVPQQRIQLYALQPREVWRTTTAERLFLRALPEDLRGARFPHAKVKEVFSKG
jgi:DUF917 family protein